MRSLGFQHSKNDYSLFHKQQVSSIVLLALYVDDIVITGNNPTEITALKTCLDDKFKIKELGELSYFLSMEIIKVSNSLVLTQRKFALDLTKEFHYDTLSATPCRLGPSSKTSPTTDTLADASNYKKLVGKLNYLSNTRPKIAFAVQ